MVLDYLCLVKLIVELIPHSGYGHDTIISRLLRLSHNSLLFSGTGQSQSIVMSQIRIPLTLLGNLVGCESGNVYSRILKQD